MKRNFIKTIAAVMSALILSLTCSNIVYAASGSAPDWIKKLDGVTVDPKAEEKAQQDAEKEVALKQWREEKANKKVPILLYHHITNEKFSKEQSISLISPEDFRLHMTAIKVNYTPISLREYIDYVLCDDGSKNIPDDSIIVTFDDGYSSNYEIAYPILKELEIPATIFVVTDTVGEQAGGGVVNYSHFTWEQAREMEDSGLIEIQSHTAGHVRMTTKERGEEFRQLRKSKYEIEKNLGRTCDMIAYPYGDYTSDIKQMARDSGYKVQLLVDDKTTEEDYMVNVPTDGVENLTRMTIAGSMGNVNVIEIIRKTIAKRK